MGKRRAHFLVVPALIVTFTARVSWAQRPAPGALLPPPSVVSRELLLTPSITTKPWKAAERAPTSRYVAIGAAIGATLSVTLTIISFHNHPPGSEDPSDHSMIIGAGIAGGVVGGLAGWLAAALAHDDKSRGHRIGGGAERATPIAVQVSTGYRWAWDGVPTCSPCGSRNAIDSTCSGSIIDSAAIIPCCAKAPEPWHGMPRTMPRETRPPFWVSRSSSGVRL
jgi:hypothetical protein